MSSLQPPGEDELAAESELVDLSEISLRELRGLEIDRGPDDRP
jgi:hypothetical protein